MLPPSDRIALETTVVGFAQDAFHLVCAAFFEQRLLDHLDAYRDSADVTIDNLPTDWAALVLNGPRARGILSACSDADLSNTGFRWLFVRQITVAGVDLWAFRMSHAGELGWEFHIPRKGALRVYDALMAAGEPLGLTDCGSFAMHALRMEQSLKGAGQLTNEVTMAEADVLSCARSDKAYMGRDMTLALANCWICAYLQIEPDGEIGGHGGGAVLCNGQVVGATASVAYGPTVGQIVAFGYLRPESAHPGTSPEVVIHGVPRAALVLTEPAHDPQGILPRTDAIEVAAE
jgi:dimethylglycine dehydrogenase